MKKRLSNSIDEKTFDMFQVTTIIMQQDTSKLLTQFMKDYIIRNKAEVNEILKQYFKNENN